MQRVSRDQAREEILGRVRAALADVSPEDRATPAPTPPPGVRLEGDALLDRFVERVEDYKATVRRCAPDDLAATVAEALASLGEGARAVVPAGLEVDVPGAVSDDALTSYELDDVEAVVTAARVGIAETGTIVLDHGPDQGRRAISLVPDLHVCIVRTDQVVADVPDAVAGLDPTRAMTWISGPSATSDIELDRVEGVHGPRTLHVVLVG
ncbi:Lactate utilization protein C [Nocardioides aquaticus]|uniref:Lactate utilization protein C n=1 Tax=Nocardioides aquaticus TaxID=160826 RepID=A0ABX8EH39_9ACTN|nr:LUD domain-containing protein [Nocardioides aquaticus]QVT77973.1 Lactate utilization protein C [Nocardioides aquaticus]